MYPFDASWLEKVESIRSEGSNPWPDASGLPVNNTSTELHQRYHGIEDPSTESDGSKVTIGGRLMFKNVMGRAMFLRIADGEETAEVTSKETGETEQIGGVIQVYARKNELGDETFSALKQLDVGDIIWVEGTLMRTRTGELTIKATGAVRASKIMTSFPDRWHSVTDIQVRSRQRYVDLFMNDATRSTFRTRSRIVRFIRDFFEDRGFMEVETPMLQNKAGGATARPFSTHHNALDIELFMRVAPELYLKRLVVGGFGRVFEINRNFRNEGISQKHNPEFTMLEYYQAWATVTDLMDLQEQLLSTLAVETTGSDQVQFQDRVIDFSAPFKRVDMDVLISEQTGLSLDQLQDVGAMRDYYLGENPKADSSQLPDSLGKWWEILFDAEVEHTLINPTFVTGYPAEISPLSRRRDDDPDRVDRYELFVNGWELVNGFTELNDPIDQAERFSEQARAKAAGDDEAMAFDHDYIRALTYGMPPTAGAGMGIDRLVMLLTNNASIREVILFPTLRPETFDTDADGDE